MHKYIVDRYLHYIKANGKPKLFSHSPSSLGKLVVEILTWNTMSQMSHNIKLFNSFKTSDLLRRWFLLKICSVDAFANNAYRVSIVQKMKYTYNYIVLGLLHPFFLSLQIIKFCRMSMGEFIFKKTFKPLVYDIYVAGDGKEVWSYSQKIVVEFDSSYPYKWVSSKY